MPTLLFNLRMAHPALHSSTATFNVLECLQSSFLSFLEVLLESFVIYVLTFIELTANPKGPHTLLASYTFLPSEINK